MSNAPATAYEEAYQSVVNDLNDSTDPRIAPDRCIWRVTVQAAWDGLGGPFPGGHAKPAPAFAVLFDVNSGFMFEIAPIYQ
jgi:hypothetical protein